MVEVDHSAAINAVENHFSLGFFEKCLKSWQGVYSILMEKVTSDIRIKVEICVIRV